MGLSRIPMARNRRVTATISFGWGNAKVSLQTKKIKGLHENDGYQDWPHIRAHGRCMNEL
jgi:hypothetical protein